MEYRVHVIDDCDLPAEVAWAFVRVEGCLQFWLRASVAEKPAALEAALEEGWDAYRQIEADELLSWPEPAVAAC